MATQTADVQLKRVKKWYGPVAAVKGIDLAISGGEMVSFLGPSGCGKTTTLRMIAGLEEPDEGEIVIRGVTMNDIPTYKRNIGMVFQNYALFPHMTVFDNIAFGLSMRKESRGEVVSKVKEVMARVRLETMADRRPSQLSGGQRQRVALARAIVTKPDVLLLDEPLGALDKKLREQMQIEIRMLQREVGITTIFVTHDQEEALTLSDRIVVMDGGSIVQVGTPQEIYQRPATPFVSDFIGVSNAIQAVAGERRGGWLSVSMRDSDAIVLAPIDESAQSGQAVEISVRPENIVLGHPQADGYNVLQGTVSHVIYTGALTYFHLDAGPGAKFIALAPNTSVDTVSGQPKVGSNITFGWRYEATRLLAAQ